jgi:DNA-binding transcriptional LysR family regulator
VAVETDQREALVPLVLAGAGATVVPRPMAEPAAAAGAVVVTLDPPLWRDLGLVRRTGDPSPAARRFLDLALRPDPGVPERGPGLSVTGPE